MSHQQGHAPNLSNAPAPKPASSYEPKVISGYEHSYAHHNPQRYAYLGKDDGKPEWIDYRPKVARDVKK